VVLAITVAGTATVAFLQPRQYSSTATFMPQAPDGASGRLPGLAAQLGLNLRSQEPGTSPEFYANLITSREILAAVVSRLQTADGTSPRDLASLLRARGSTPERLFESTVRRLRAGINVRVVRQTGVVALEAHLPAATLASQTVQAILDEVNEFNLARRQSQARQERRFAEQRLREAETELQQMEDRLAEFIRSNRLYRQSPSLQFEYDRLQRQVSLRQEVVMALAQSHEQARLDEIRGTPVITVVERPREPIDPDSRRLPVRVLLGGIVGGMLGIGVAYARITLREVKTRHPEIWAQFGGLPGRRKRAGTDPG
jgi:uncharacterized protein involved in exopolysaccharide biosynthesis